jgi:SAM-dependent methyltransferase
MTAVEPRARAASSERAVERVCEACGGRDLRPMLPPGVHTYRRGAAEHQWTYQLLVCGGCGLGMVHPLPTLDILATFYNEDYGSYDGSAVDPAREAHSSKYRIAEYRFASLQNRSPGAFLKTAAGRLAETVSGKTVSHTLGVPLQLPKDAAILEVGYGSGSWLLSLAELGYTCLHGYDIDVNGKHVRRLRERGVSITGGAFHDNVYPEEGFDCIRLEHVFEHIPDPMESLAHYRRLLTPGGYLVMNVPCFDSWCMRVDPITAPTMQLPLHLFHHTPGSLRLMLEKAGFRVLEARPHAVASNLLAGINGLRSLQGRRALPGGLAALIAPFYRTFSIATRKGEFLSALATR